MTMKVLGKTSYLIFLYTIVCSQAPLNLGMVLRLNVLLLHAFLEPTEGKETIKAEELDFTAKSGMVSLFCHRKTLNHQCACVTYFL